VVDVQRLLDPEVAAAISKFSLGMGSLSRETLPAIRNLALPSAPLLDEVERRDRTVKVGEGVPNVTVRVHRPIGRHEPLPALVWIHGGGFVMGTAAMEDRRLDEWARSLGCVCVNVDYRLAPKVPYPGALDDCYAALRWVHDNPAALGVDRDLIGVGGISAGGGLSAAVALAARDRREVRVAFQCLIYPMLDDRMAHPSNAWEAPVWPPSANRFGWAAYLGELLGGGDVPPYAAPGRATDLAGLPPTFVGVGALDCFLDEDVDYAVSLAHSGVPVELHVYPGACHGLDSMAPFSPPGMQLRRDVEAWLARALAGDLPQSQSTF
jgi:acetyl esterase/lipase